MVARGRRSINVALLLALCVLTGSRGAFSVQARGAETAAQVRSLIDTGRYDDAQAAAEYLVSETTSKTGADSGETADATSLLIVALLLNGRGTDATTALAERVARSEEARLGSNNPALATPLRNLGDALFQAGDYSRAVAVYDRAVLIRERDTRAAPLELGEDLDHFARALTRSTRYDEAARQLDRSLRLKEKTVGATDVRIARTLEGLGWLYHRKGDYAQSRPVLDRALAIREAAQPAHPEIVGTLNLVGDQRWFDSDLAEARNFYLRAVESSQRSLRADHPDIALSLRNLSLAVDNLGNFAEAQSLRAHALAIAEKNFGPTHPQLAGYLNDLAVSDKHLGDYSGARVMYERALKIKEDRLGRDHLDVATTVHNLAVLHALLGDFGEARRLHDRAIATWRVKLGPEHPYIALALESLGEVLLEQKLNSQARSLLEQAVAIRERSLGGDHRDVAVALAYLAKALARLGALDRARQLSARAIAILERASAEDSPTLASGLTLQGDLEAEKGDFHSARRSYERALAIRTRVVGASHPDYAQSQAGLALALAGLGESTPAVNSALQAEETGRQHLRLTVRNLPERQSLGYAANRPKGLDLAMSLSTADRLDSRVVDALIRSRALVLDEMAARRHVAVDASRADLAPLWTALTSASQRLANLVVRGPSDQRPQQYVALVDDARREKELAERALADKSATFRAELTRDEIGLDDVRTALPERSALVAFVRYERTIIVPTASSASPQSTASSRPARRIVPSYVAFVIRAGQPGISMVPLGSASGVDALVARWRHEATDLLRASAGGDAESTYRAVGAELRKRVWDPIVSRVKDIDTVFVVPDGTLNTVSLAALPAGPAKYLIDQRPVIHYLTAERDLVAAPTSTANQGLLAVGGAAFDDATLFTRRAARPAVVQAGASTAAAAKAPRLRASCGDLTSVRFEPLAATTKEVHEVAKLWTESPAQLLENRGATERAFKQAAPGHRVLHLATHGFFLGSTCAPTTGGTTRSVGGLTTASKKPPNGASNGESTESPLLLSGLALAGANRRAFAGPDEDDGILTAEEVTGLNLDGVEWAVLSACDTGLGEVKVGEGVFGLRRAFQVAGVRTVIMSLWSVEDQATLEWMRALYAGHLQKKLSTADAMRDASLTVLRARRARGLSTHPFYWGGFVAAGDWR